MQQRRVRLGDILDDYCPRERRVTNHVVVAMIDEEVKQTRCTTCDADHEYKHARVPALRRKRGDPAVPADVPHEPAEAALVSDDEAAAGEPPSVEAVTPSAAASEPESDSDVEPAAAEEDGPVHRRLIRATLPRPDGQAPERREPDFTIRQSGFRGRPFDQKNGQRPGRGPRPQGGGSQFGSPRQGSGHAPRHGSGQGFGQAPRHGSGQRPAGPGFRQGGNRPGPPGGPRGPRPGGGRGGRKRGR